MTANIVIMQLAILAVVLESDLGRRKIGWFRVGRPIIGVALIVPFFFTSLPTGGNDLLLQGASALAGAALGLFAVCPLLVSVDYHPDWRRRWPRASPSSGRPAAVSRSGVGYAAVWVAVTAARLGFAYGAQHIFPVGLGEFMTSHHLSEVALTNGFIFLSVSMSLFRSLGLWVRRRARLAQADTVVAQGSVVGAARVTGGRR
ncbi:hypothetical protein [Amycolatopsis australiensis]|uniref:Uncharacterized protein n=1 Tax=Amycolatopsis australiensis TaxID=546364 RepID=A0A1K1RRU6_9PSEU|nr:hypothetical protein [Amycolatopsis australiensis]SFW74602.1 hypothetical protein SAMN04489730_3799 [Amycolatopsis australiensis]